MISSLRQFTSFLAILSCLFKNREFGVWRSIGITFQASIALKFKISRFSSFFYKSLKSENTIPNNMCRKRSSRFLYAIIVRHTKCRCNYFINIFIIALIQDCVKGITCEDGKSRARVAGPVVTSQRCGGRGRARGSGARTRVWCTCAADRVVSR